MSARAQRLLNALGGRVAPPSELAGEEAARRAIDGIDDLSELRRILEAVEHGAPLLILGTDHPHEAECRAWAAAEGAYVVASPTGPRPPAAFVVERLG